MCEPAEKTPHLSPTPTHRHGSLAVFVGGDGALAVDVRPRKQCSEQDEHVHGRQESELSDDCGRGGGSRRERCLLAANQPKNTRTAIGAGRETARKRFRGEKISEQNASGFWKTFFPNGLVAESRTCTRSARLSGKAGAIALTCDPSRPLFARNRSSTAEKEQSDGAEGVTVLEVRHHAHALKGELAPNWLCLPRFQAKRLHVRRT